MSFDRGDRTYYVSDERLKAFKALSTEEKLRWQEELATFLLMAQAEKQAAPEREQTASIKPPSA